MRARELLLLLVVLVLCEAANKDATIATPRATSSEARPGLLKLIPSVLDWRERPICIPATEELQIVNEASEELQIFSISTDNIQFHPSSFKQTTIAPHKWARIPIVFVPRVIGPVHCKLVLQTSSGGLTYEMHGKGVENAYRVSPLSGRLPAGVPFTPQIMLHNPFDDPLNVREVFANEDFLHLNLPLSSSDSPAAGLWQVPAHATRSVIALEFVSNHPGKFQGFVHLKTDRDDLIIQVDINVVKGGLLPFPEELDFGTLISTSEKRSLSLSLLNSSPAPISILDVYPLVADAHLHIEFRRGIILNPNVESDVLVAVWSGHQEGNFAGKLLVRTNATDPANARLEVPYRSRVLHGTVGYSFLNSTFRIDGPPFKAQVHQLSLTNKFSTPLHFLSAEIQDPHFEVQNFSEGLVLPAGASGIVLSIKFQASEQRLYNTNLKIMTDISALHIPLHAYHGRLRVTNVEDNLLLSEVNFGTVSVNELRSRSFMVTNPNPVKVPLYHVGNTIGPELTVRLDAVTSKGIASVGQDAMAKIKKSSEGNWKEPILILDANMSTVWTAEIATSREEGRKGDIVFETAFETLRVPVSFESIQGTLAFSPAVVRFDGSFPGRTLRKTLSAKSSFSKPLRVMTISSSDPRINVTIINDLLQPNAKVQVGHVSFDPGAGTSTENFMRQTVDLASGHATEMDVQRALLALRERDRLWETLAANGGTDIRATVTIDTDVVRGLTVAIRASLVRPSILVDTEVDLGSCQVGGAVERMLRLHNPSSLPVLAQILLSQSSISESGEDLVARSGTGSLASLQLAPNRSHQIVIPPLSHAEFGPLIFAPTAPSPISTTAFIVNNLTLVEAIRVSGEGASGRLSIIGSGVSPVLRGQPSLHVEVSGRDLGLYENGSLRAPIRIMKSFVVRNLGSLLVHIQHMGIDSHFCASGSVAIADCNKLAVESNHSTQVQLSIDIDCQSAFLSHVLWLDSSMGLLRFPLRARTALPVLRACQYQMAASMIEESVRHVITTACLFCVCLLVRFTALELVPCHISLASAGQWCWNAACAVPKSVFNAPATCPLAPEYKLGEPSISHANAMDANRLPLVDATSEDEGINDGACGMQPQAVPPDLVPPAAGVNVKEAAEIKATSECNTSPLKPEQGVEGTSQMMAGHPEPRAPDDESLRHQQFNWQPNTDVPEVEQAKPASVDDDLPFGEAEHMPTRVEPEFERPCGATTDLKPEHSLESASESSANLENSLSAFCSPTLQGQSLLGLSSPSVLDLAQQGLNEERDLDVSWDDPSTSNELDDFGSAQVEHERQMLRQLNSIASSALSEQAAVTSPETDFIQGTSWATGSDGHSAPRAGHAHVGTISAHQWDDLHQRIIHPLPAFDFGGYESSGHDATAGSGTFSPHFLWGRPGHAPAPIGPRPFSQSTGHMMHTSEVDHRAFSLFPSDQPSPFTSLTTGDSLFLGGLFPFSGKVQQQTHQQQHAQTHGQLQQPRAQDQQYRS